MRALSLLMVVLASVTLAAQQPGPPTVTNADLLAGLPADGSKWLMYHGNYFGHRYSPLTQITPQNVNQLKAAWTFQTRLTPNFQTTPIFVDNVLYVTGFGGYVWAIDARTGRQIWQYRKEMADDFRGCCGPNNRGAAVHGDKLFVGTGDAHLIALDLKTGTPLWDAELANYKHGYSITVAPLVVKDKVIVGMAGAEFGIRGFIQAHDVNTGKPVWRFYTVAGPDEPGGQTWPKGTDAYLRGGGSIWVTGTYDPEQNLVFFGTGNPGPDYWSPVREGDNLYTCSAVALDADTGQLKWHFQFTPHDVHDWDSTQVPVLADLTINGQPRKTMLFANRNGFFYVLDRTNGKMILAKPFIAQNWAKEISPEGRPILVPGTNPSEEGSAKTCPDLGGGTNQFSPSYDPAQRLFFVTARETCAIYFTFNEPFRQGEQYQSGGTVRVRDQPSYGALRAIDPLTGDRRWEFRYPSTSSSGVLTTASGLVFAGDGDGNIIALDSKSGKYLWHYQLGVGLRSTSGTTYMVDGRQYLLVPSGSALTAFALPQ
jgi:alcohol dehydrogenase (cytochrome c)